MTSWFWARQSLECLVTVHPILRKCCDYTLARSQVDLMAREGRRDMETQERYFRMGLSHARWGQSAHNFEPPEFSHAVHLIPVPVDWESEDWKYRCAQTAQLMYMAGQELDIEIIWGGWWPRLRDLCHFEIDRSIR